MVHQLRSGARPDMGLSAVPVTRDDRYKTSMPPCRKVAEYCNSSNQNSHLTTSQSMLITPPSPHVGWDLSNPNYPLPLFGVRDGLAAIQQYSAFETHKTQFDRNWPTISETTHYCGLSGKRIGERDTPDSKEFDARVREYVYNQTETMMIVGTRIMKRNDKKRKSSYGQDVDETEDDDMSGINDNKRMDRKTIEKGNQWGAIGTFCYHRRKITVVGSLSLSSSNGFQGIQDQQKANSDAISSHSMSLRSHKSSATTEGNRNNKMVMGPPLLPHRIDKKGIKELDIVGQQRNKICRDGVPDILLAAALLDDLHWDQTIAWFNVVNDDVSARQMPARDTRLLIDEGSNSSLIEVSIDIGGSLTPLAITGAND